MAKLMLIGDVANVELTVDDEDGQIIAICTLHPEVSECGWTERYDTLRDASEYAADHADRGVI